jgi:hypothetical protein
VHHDPPEVTWPPPELDAGAEDGELSPLEEELPDEELPDEELPDEELPDVPVPPDVPELAEEPEEARPVLFAAELDDV